MASTWQYIPNQIAEEDKQQQELDAWRQAQQQRLADTWAEMQKQSAAERFKQAEAFWRQRQTLESEEERTPSLGMAEGSAGQTQVEQPSEQMSPEISQAGDVQIPNTEGAPGGKELLDKVGEAWDVASKQGRKTMYNVGDLVNPLGPRFNQAWTDPLAHNRALDTEAQNWTGMLPEGPIRGIAGAAGELLNQAATGEGRVGGVTDVTAARSRTLPENEQWAEEQRAKLAADWQRWQTEKENPLVEAVGELALNPANYAADPITGLNVAKKAAKGAEKIAPEVERVARQLAAEQRGGAELGETLGKVSEAALPKMQNIERDAAGNITRWQDEKGNWFKRYFHGTGSDFKQFDPSKEDSDALFGAGTYFTSNADVASGYAKERASSASKSKRSSTGSMDDLTELWQDAYGGAQIRPVDVPESLKLFKTDAPDITPDEIQAITAVLPQGQQVSFRSQVNNARFNGSALSRLEQYRNSMETLENAVRSAEKAAQTDEYAAAALPGFRQKLAEAQQRMKDIQEGKGVDAVVTGERVYQILADVTNNKAHANEALAKAGYDGLQYPGGRHMPIYDETGKAVLHDALVVFPDSLPKITNALSKTQGGNVNVGTALDIGSGTAGAASQYDENATPEQNIARMTAGGLVGVGLQRALRQGILGQSVQNVMPEEALLQEAIAPKVKPLRQAADEALGGFARAMYDRNWNLGALERATKVAVHQLAQVVAGSVAAGEDRVRRAVMPVIKFVGKKDTKNLEEYMVGMRNKDLLANNPNVKLPNNLTAAQNDAALAQFEQRLGPERFAKVAAAADRLWEVNRNLILQPLLDEGMITQGAFVGMVTAHPHYIDFHRQGYSITDQLVNIVARPEGNVSGLNIKKLNPAGSELRVDQPLARTEAQIIRTATLVARNRAAKGIVGALQDLERNTGQSLVKILRPSDVAKHSDFTDTISYFENGKKVMVQVPTVYATIAKGLEGEASNVFVNFLGWASRPIRAGAVTYNPAFLIVNPIRDAVSALYREGLVPLSPEYIRGVVAAVTKNADFTDAAEAGALMSGIVDNFRSTEALSRAKALGSLQVNSWQDALALPFRVIKHVNQIGEESTRVATYHKLRGQGLSELEAAVRARDVTVDFAKSGTVMKMVNQIIPFANAGLQGAANIVRLIKDNPKQAVIAATTLNIPTALVFLNNQRFETSGMIPESDYSQNWVVQFAEGTKKTDPKNPGKAEKFPIYIKIPKGPLGAAITAPMEIALRAAFIKNDRSVVEHLLKGLETEVQAMSPVDPSFSGLMPPAANTGVGLLFNKDTFTGRDIVPQSMKNLAPEDQYDTHTGRASIGAADLLARATGMGVSPKLLDWSIGDFAGGVGQQANWLVDIALGALGYNPQVPGESKQRELSEEEQTSRVPIVNRFYGTRSSEISEQEWDRFNTAVRESQRALADVSELHRLGITASPVVDYITIDEDTRINLTPAERAELQKLETDAIIAQAERISRSKTYQKLPDDEKRKELQADFSTIREDVRDKYLFSKPKAWRKQKLSESESR